jgi:glutamine amidotransferase
MVTIIDYGMGNVGSVLNMLKKIGVKAILSSGSEDLLKADRLILPGVGAFDAGMTNLKEKGYLEVLNKLVLQKKIPILGICLGMQLMTKCSEEGVMPGLGWVDATTIRFGNLPSGMKIPHMGWDYIQLRKPSDLLPDSIHERRYYFVHSFYVSCKYSDDVLSTTKYGDEFVSSFCHENILGSQFHPEKSHRFGFEFLRNFMNWNPVISKQTSL